MNRPTCETCRWRGEFYIPPDHAVSALRTYKCVRRAPMVTGGLHAPTMTVWPWVTLTDTCGEHTRVKALEGRLGKP